MSPVGNKQIRMTLAPDSIDKAIAQLQAYMDSLDSKAEKLRQRIAEQIQWSAQSGFSTALSSDIYTGGTPPPPDVNVSIQDDGDVTVVIAEGEDAVFIEFGAGVYHNGAVGASPHPDGADAGFTIGSYGKGQGKYNSWALPGSTAGAFIRTHGTPAAMPMYYGVQDALRVLTDLAKEVFNGD